MAAVTVLDASALIALFKEEPGAGKVASLLPTSAISTVNLVEVHEQHAARQPPDTLAALDIVGLGIEIVPFSAAQAELAARLRPATRKAGLSLADRACLALAAQRGATAVTADQSWTLVDVGVKVRLIR